MKLSVKFNSEGMPMLVLKYRPEEWAVLERNGRELGLERRRTTNLWGVNWEAEFYKERNSMAEGLIRGLFEAEGLRYRILSDINSPVFRDSRVNVGILRVVPDENLEVRAPLPHLINVDDLIYIRDIIASAVKLILKVVTQAECEVKFILNGKELGGEEYVRHHCGTEETTE
jgi:hypothetical protein